MNIKLTNSEFDTLIQKRYVIIPKNRKSGISVDIRELTNWKDKQVLLFSNIEKIATPNLDIKAQLNTLYGIPEGLFGNSKSNNYKPSSQNQKWSDNDKVYLYLRRALLFMSVWGIKERGVDIIEKLQNNLFNNSLTTSLPFFYELIKELSKCDDFPAHISDSPSIESTQYTFQVNWLGRFLNKTLFDGGKMDKECREWLIKILETPDLTIPEKFKSYELILKSYLLALKYNQGGRYGKSYISDQAQLLANENHSSDEIITLTYFFFGFFEKSSDLYYMTAGAKTLMIWIENFAFATAFEIKTAIDPTESIAKIKESELKAIENCFQYYCIKNPAISNRPHYEFSTNPDHDPKGNVVILKPHECKNFLERYTPMIDGQKLVKDYVHQTNEQKSYTNLIEAGADAIWVNQQKNTFSVSISDCDLNKKILLWNEESIIEQFKNWKKIKFEKAIEIKNQPVAIILLNNRLNNIYGSILRLYAKKTNPSRLVVLNFTTNTEKTSSSSKEANKNSKKSMETSSTQHTNSGELKYYFDNLFPDSVNSIITKFPQDDHWEMVKLGIGALKNYDFSEIKIFDFRDFKDFDVEETLMRFFRDTIVYDKQQKYFFLNL